MGEQAISAIEDRPLGIGLFSHHGLFFCELTLGPIATSPLSRN